MSGQVITVDWHTAYCMFCACIQKQSGEEIMPSQITDYVEMVSRTKVISAMIPKLVLVELTAILKLIQYTCGRSL